MREFPPGALEFGALGIASGVFRLAVLLPALVLRRGLLSFVDLSLGRSGELLYLSSLLLVSQACLFPVSKLTTVLFRVDLGALFACLFPSGACCRRS